jgi:hypothetical protein
MEVLSVVNHGEKAHLLKLTPHIIVSGAMVSSTQSTVFFFQHLQHISTIRGQIVVFECRVQATTTVQVHWYREKEQIANSDDFRILRKSNSN